MVLAVAAVVVGSWSKAPAAVALGGQIYLIGGFAGTTNRRREAASSSAIS